MAKRFLRSFTLLELLVAVAIITAVAALLTPALSKAKERVRRTQCMSNERQILLAMHLYAHDHQDLLPRANYIGTDFGWHDWAGLLTNELENLTVGIFKCPSDRNKRLFAPAGAPIRSYCLNAFQDTGNNIPSGYRLPWPNASFDADQEPPAKLSQVPAHVFLIMENHGGFAGEEEFISSAVVGSASFFHHYGIPAGRTNIYLAGATTQPADSVHDGGGNYGFADGHVQYYRAATLEATAKLFVDYGGSTSDIWKYRE